MNRARLIEEAYVQAYLAAVKRYNKKPNSSDSRDYELNFWNADLLYSIRLGSKQGIRIANQKLKELRWRNSNET